MAGQETVQERVMLLVEPLLVTLGFELVELEYKREGRDWMLRFFLDKEGGITLDDCAEASREIGMLLEIEDVVPNAYLLEVSSPGIDRPLKKASDYARFTGRLIKVKTYERLDPDQRGHLRKTFIGTLLGLEDGQVRIEQNDKKGGVVAFTLEEIAHAQLEFEF